MSARERFFKKIKQSTAQPHHDGSVGADIQAFRHKMDELSEQIEAWLEGARIEIILSTKHLNDLSTVGASLNSGASRYDIATIELLYGARSVDITPEQLYKPGEKGCVTLVVEAPDQAVDKQKYFLSMAPRDSWFIRGEHQDVSSRILLTEEVFFRTIECLV